MAAKNRLKVTPSSGNVFRDLGFPTEEAEHLLARLGIQVRIVVKPSRRRKVA